MLHAICRGNDRCTERGTSVTFDLSVPIDPYTLFIVGLMLGTIFGAVLVAVLMGRNER